MNIEDVIALTTMRRLHARRGNPELPATPSRLSSGDAGQAAHILKASGYFSGRESDYVSGMTKHEAAIDAQLGPVTP